jgi:hypothetical protein
VESWLNASKIVLEGRNSGNSGQLDLCCAFHATLDGGNKLNPRRHWKTDGVYMNQTLNDVLNLRQGKPSNLPKFRVTVR